MGKSSKQETTQESSPPKWAQPLLERGAGDAMKLYDAGTGFNTYTGPTQADLSAPTLSGMNNMLAATGFQGAPVTNQSINSAVPNVQAIMAQALANKPKPQMAQQPQALWGGPQMSEAEQREQARFDNRYGEGAYEKNKQRQSDSQFMRSGGNR